MTKEEFRDAGRRAGIVVIEETIKLPPRKPGGVPTNQGAAPTAPAGMRGDFAAQLEAAKRFNEGRSWDSPDLPLALGDAKAAIRAYAESGEAKELDAIPAVHTTDLDHFRWGSWRANLRTGEVAVLSDAGIVEGRFVRTRQGLAVSMQRIFLLPK